MNGLERALVVDHDKIVSRPDLLAHKYRPDSVSKIKCHQAQAQHLREWILDFRNATRGNRDNNHDDSDSDSDTSTTIPEVARKCVLLTGPPGVGKTSLVYTVASELNLHVVESHPSEKRDFKLFSTLKQANQKGKINPIAKLFQFAQEKKLQTPNASISKRKRRKLDELQQTTDNGTFKSTSSQCLSLSGDSSILLFDDVDVVFDEDGPFLKSLVEFIKDSKRPVVLTATQSIDAIKAILIHFEHIYLGPPMIDECIQVLRDVCRKEHLSTISKVSNCRIIARRTNCDIRQSLNRIHFYGDGARSIEDDQSEIRNIEPNLTRLNEFLTNQDVAGDDGISDHDDSRKTIIDRPELDLDIMTVYNTNTLIDLIDSKFNFIDRHTLLARWLGGRPSVKNEEYSHTHELGEQIKRSISELTHDIYHKEMISQDDLLIEETKFTHLKQSVQSMCQLMNSKIQSRLEPPEVEFYTDIVPMLGTTIKLEADRRRQHQQQAANGNGTSDVEQMLTSSRRTRRVQSYLDSVAIYLEPEDYALICDTLLKPSNLEGEDPE